MYEDLGSGNSFKHFDDIKSQQIGELAYAWSEERVPEFGFTTSDVLQRNPNAWNERFYITIGNNPFVKADELRRARSAMYDTIARLFTDVWSVEKHDFAYWYDLERNGYQGWLRKAVMKSRQERVKALLSYSPGQEISLESLNATLPSFAESLCASLEHIMRFRRDGTERTREEASRLEKSFGDANRISEAPFELPADRRSRRILVLLWTSIADDISYEVVTGPSGRGLPMGIGTIIVRGNLGKPSSLKTM